MKVRRRPKETGGEWVDVDAIDNIPFTVYFTSESFSRRGPFPSKRVDEGTGQAEVYYRYEIPGKFSWLNPGTGEQVTQEGRWSLFDGDYRRLIEARLPDGDLKYTKWKMLRSKEGTRIVFLIERVQADHAAEPLKNDEIQGHGGGEAPSPLETKPPPPARVVPNLCDRMLRAQRAAQLIAKESGMKDTETVREIGNSMFIAEGRGEGVIPDVSHAYPLKPTCWKIADELSEYRHGLGDADQHDFDNLVMVCASETADEYEDAGGQAVHGVHEFVTDKCARAKKEAFVHWVQAVYGRICAADAVFNAWRKGRDTK